MNKVLSLVFATFKSSVKCEILLFIFLLILKASSILFKLPCTTVCSWSNASCSVTALFLSLINKLVLGLKVLAPSDTRDKPPVNRVPIRKSFL